MEGGDTTNLLKENEYVDDPKEALTGGENLVGHKINLNFSLAGRELQVFSHIKYLTVLNMNFLVHVMCVISFPRNDV